MHAFLSHISDEALEARALKTALEKALPGLSVLVSATDIHLGQGWLDEIDHALAEAKLILTLCSPNSIRRPWINFESGSGWTRRIHVIPICHRGMRKDRLPDPCGSFRPQSLRMAIPVKNSCGSLERCLISLRQPILVRPDFSKI
jgi:hypothetical protein